MQKIILTVEHEAGLHARPAALFVKTASSFKSEINVEKDGQTANAKSMLSILTLGVNQGTEITIRAKGEDAEEALATLETLITSNFGEAE